MGTIRNLRSSTTAQPRGFATTATKADIAKNCQPQPSKKVCARMVVVVKRPSAEEKSSWLSVEKAKGPLVGRGGLCRYLIEEWQTGHSCTAVG
jgi:hypothetical protein